MQEKRLLALVPPLSQVYMVCDNEEARSCCILKRGSF